MRYGLVELTLGGQVELQLGKTDQRGTPHFILNMLDMRDMHYIVGLKKNSTIYDVMKTKEFLIKVKISESTLRRWLRPDGPIPGLHKASRDWRGCRNWTNDHVQMVLKYKNDKVAFFKTKQPESIPTSTNITVLT